MGGGIEDALDVVQPVPDDALSTGFAKDTNSRVAGHLYPTKHHRDRETDGAQSHLETTRMVAATTGKAALLTVPSFSAFLSEKASQTKGNQI